MAPALRSRRSRRPAFALTFVVIVALAACATTTTLPEEPPNREELIVEAIGAAERTEYFEARYNPPDCPCPPFEVRFADRWVRVALEDADEDDRVSARMLREATEDHQAGARAPYFVTGVPDDDRIQHCSTGFPVVVFQLEAFSREVPAAPES